MNNLMVYSFFMKILFIMLLILSLNFYFLDYSLFMEWMIFSMNSINMEFIMLIDWISLLFISFVMLISSMVLLYCCSYMSSEKFIGRFMLLVNLFILSMVLMIISPNLISILFGWDGLGLVSYCLVIYYQNMMSFNSGMLTVLSNRIGDIGLLITISLLMMNGSWNYFYMVKMKMVMFMLLLAAITKSAQVPFSSWLPSAMAAPTPVSALVHSSTLVTAGVYLMIRFNKFLVEMGGSKILMYLSVLTMFMAGLMANVENDFKKIIALSTLSQLGLMMMILCLGLKMMGLYHLLTHAIFKSLLFLCAGAIIHSMSNNQDIRLYGNLNEFMPFVMSGFYISSLSLCGYPFLAGFYSKDLIMEFMYFNKINLMMIMMSLLSLIFTVSYSLRVIYYIYFSEMNLIPSFYIKENFIMNLSMFSLLFFSMLCGSMMMWLFFYDIKMILLSIEVKLLTMIMCMLGVTVGAIFYFKIFLKMYKSLMFFSSMWFLNFMFMFIYKPYLKIGLSLQLTDKLWVEFSKKNMYYEIIYYMVEIKVNKMKMFMFMYMFIIFILFLLFL